ncbi:hypothetical protein KW787_03760 [Candidatus Pacearchaeota archaeon]|nr:hypothetical protein [Candidatus Pacearchaeota archaeon]
MDKQRKVNVSKHLPVPSIIDFYFIIDKRVTKPLYTSMDRRLFTKEEYKLFETGADLVYTAVGIYRKLKQVSFARQISYTDVKKKTTASRTIPITFVEYEYMEDHKIDPLAIFDC